MIAPAVLMGRLRPLALPRGTVNGEVGSCVTYALCVFVGQMLLDYQGYRWTIESGHTGQCQSNHIMDLACAPLM